MQPSIPRPALLPTAAACRLAALLLLTLACLPVAAKASPERCAGKQIKMARYYASCVLVKESRASLLGEASDTSACTLAFDAKYGEILELDCGDSFAEPSAVQVRQTLDVVLDAVVDAANAAIAPESGAAFCGTGTIWSSVSEACIAGTPTPTPAASPTPTPTRTPIADACPNETFLDIDGSTAAGAGYPATNLEVSCSATLMTVLSNGIPPYEFVAITPNNLQAQNYSWDIPLNATPAVSTSSIALLGPVAIVVNGLPVYGPNEAAMPDPYGDPVANGIMDYCGGHTGPGGTYHNHEMLLSCLMGATPAGEASPVVGWSFDGFPIYGPMGCLDVACTQVVKMKSGWDTNNYTTAGCASDAVCGSTRVCAREMVNGVETSVCQPKTYAWTNHTFTTKAGGAYLDQCNGRYGPDGTYRYHMTTTFPYILGCYRGTPRVQ